MVIDPYILTSEHVLIWNYETLSELYPSEHLFFYCLNKKQYDSSRGIMCIIYLTKKGTSCQLTDSFPLLDTTEKSAHGEFMREDRPIGSICKTRRMLISTWDKELTNILGH